MKYKKTMTEIQDHILNSPGDGLIYPVDSSFYSEYKILIEEVFGLEKSKIAAKIEKYVNSETKKSFVRRNAKNLKDFFYFIFSDDELKAMDMFKKFNWIE